MSPAPIAPRPSLQTTQTPQPGSSGSKRRKAHVACLACKSRKTGCNGGDPCSSCSSHSTRCVYDPAADKRRKIAHDRNNEELSRRGDELEKQRLLLRGIMSIFRTDQPNLADELLRMLRGSADLSKLTEYVQRTISQISDVEEGYQQIVPHSDLLLEDIQNPLTFLPKNRESTMEESAPARAGHTGSQWELAKAVDLEHGSGAVGYIGNMSEISWMRLAWEQLMQSSTPESKARLGLDPHENIIKELNYFLDDVDLLSVDEDYVVAQQMPPLDVAFMLSHACFHALRGPFQFIHPESFLETLARFPRDKPIMSWEERRWLAMANLVFSVGAKWLYLTRSDDAPTHGDHVEYYARARALGLDHRIMFDHPVREQVQALGLLAFYLFVNGSISRAWTILGHAIRHAIALGLHLRLADVMPESRNQESRSLIWYALYNLESLVAEVLGRPRSIRVADVATHVDLHGPIYPPITSPRVFFAQPRTKPDSRKDQMDFLSAYTSGSHGLIQDMPSEAQRGEPSAGDPIAQLAVVLHRTSLCQISHRIETALYCDGQDQSWSDVQKMITGFEAELQEWLANLPASVFLYGDIVSEKDSSSSIELAMYYYSIRMILHRLCLCLLEGKIPNESVGSQDFDTRSARTCIAAAESMIAIMPEVTTAQQAYLLLPWWGLLHYLCQATTVLILELVLDARHVPDQVETLISSLRKSMSYLHRLATISRSALSAWEIFHDLLLKASTKFADVDMSDILQDTPLADRTF